jgi:hypothetical protein
MNPIGFRPSHSSGRPIAAAVSYQAICWTRVMTAKAIMAWIKKRGPGGPVARPESSGSYDNLLPFLVQLIIPQLVYKMRNVGKYSVLLTGRTDPLLTGWQKAPLHPPPRLGWQKNRHLAGLEGQLLFCRAGRNRSPLVGLVE